MYALQQASNAIRKNWIASISTITTMTLSLTILAGFSLLNLNLNAFLKELQGELEVAAFLEKDANHNLLINEIKNWEEVSRATFISPDEALGNLAGRYSYLQNTLGIIENPLPPTIELQLIDPSQTIPIAERLRRLPGVNEVEDGSDEVQTYLAINQALTVGGAILIIVLLTSALFAIVNSIRAAITARQKEIEVMRLVGATREFIRAPFLLEGLMLGLFSALVTLLLVAPSYAFIVNRLSPELLFIPFVRNPFLLTQLGFLITALAVLVGLIGSALSVSQYLKEEFRG